MLPIRLQINSRLLVVKFEESKKFHRFSTAWGAGAPNTRGLVLFKDQLYIYIYIYIDIHIHIYINEYLYLHCTKGKIRD